MTQTETILSSGSQVSQPNGLCAFFHVTSIIVIQKSLNLILCALCLGDNGPWEQKCQYAGSVGPFMGKWQTSRGIKK